MAERAGDVAPHQSLGRSVPVAATGLTSRAAEHQAGHLHTAGAEQISCIFPRGEIGGLYPFTIQMFFNQKVEIIAEK